MTTDEAIEVLGGLVSSAGGEGDEALDVIKRSLASWSKLPLVGRDYTLVSKYGKKLRTTPLSQRGVRGRTGATWETKRGVAWEVLLELDGEATGHVCRVEVTLDRLDHDLAERKS